MAFLTTTRWRQSNESLRTKLVASQSADILVGSLQLVQETYFHDQIMCQKLASFAGEETQLAFFREN